MKKQLLTTLLLMLFGMTAWAQNGSGWTDPQNEYSAHTVVYLTIQSDNYDVLYTPEGGAAFPEVGAFVDGQLRGWANIDDVDYSPADKTPFFTLIVGGKVGVDEGKNITFQVYDSNTGVTYDLESEDAITWIGDNSSNNPSESYLMTFQPAKSVKLYKSDSDEEVTELSLHVGDVVSLDDYEAKLVNSDGIPVNAVTTGQWVIMEGPNMPYISRVDGANGSVSVKGEKQTPLSEDTGENLFMEGLICFTIGSFDAAISVQVLPQYFPVTSIRIYDVNYYWKGFGSLALSDDMVTYNNGDSYPSNPGVKITESSNTNVVAIVGDQGLNYKGIGSSIITVAAIDNENITTTFTINILSALEGMHFESEASLVRYRSGDEYLQLPTPSFDWIMGDDGSYVIDETYFDESFTVSSSNPSILEIVEAEDGLRFVSHKKGTVTLTYTSVYDPTKSATLKVVITQAVSGVAITKVGGVEIESNTPTEPVVGVAVGQTLTAIAQITPEDADIDDFAFEIVDADGIALGDEVVAVGAPQINNGIGSVTFTFSGVPSSSIVYVKVTVNDDYSHRVRLAVTNSVTSVEIGDVPGTIWLGTDETVTFFINAIVSPDDASDKSLTVTSSDESVIIPGGVADEGAYSFEAVDKGTAVLTFTSVDNPSAKASCEVTVKRKVEELWVEGIEYELYNDGAPTNAVVTIMPEDADYNLENLSWRTEVFSDFIPEDWEFITVEEGDVQDGGSIQVVVTGRSLCNNACIVFEYDATEQGNEDLIENWQEVRVIEKVRFNTGWNWVSFVSGGLSVYEMEGSLEEARSQTSLIIDDPAWGLFGYLDWMNPYEAYKINMKEEAEVLEYVLYEGGHINGEGTVDDKVLEHGWNWESYPYEYAYNVEDIFDAAQFEEGDIILSKEDGMTTLTDGVWEGNLTTLRPNQGYLIYSNIENGQETSITMPNRYTDLEQGVFEDGARAQRRDRSVWSYDGSRFANVMAIVGKIEVEDAEDYTIGAFVGDECRGEGKFVNGKAYITAAGKAGDMVTLRLYNQWTGEYVEVLGEVAFTDIAGSAKEPIRFNAVETGVDNLTATTLTIQANVAYASGDIQVYDAQGKLVTEGYQRVDLSHLNSGVYVVKAGDASRKVIK